MSNRRPAPALKVTFNSIISADAFKLNIFPYPERGDNDAREKIHH